MLVFLEIIIKEVMKSNEMAFKQICLGIVRQKVISEK